MIRSDSSARRSWTSSSAWGVCLVAGYVLLAALPVALAFALRPNTEDSFLKEMGRGAGLMGFALLTLQVAMGARIKILDRPFGLDMVMQFHKGMAILAGVMLVLHPVLLAAGSGHWGMFYSLKSWRVNFGKMALVLLVLTILFALLFKKLNINYRLWRFLHKGAIVVIVLAFVHGILIGSDIRSTSMKVYWWVLFVMALGLFLYRNLFLLWTRHTSTSAAHRP